MGGFLGGDGGGGASKSGFAALPKDLQDAFSKLGLGVEKYTNPANAGVTDMFAPLAQTQDETAALEAFRTGFAPTQQTIQSDIAMQMNPFDTYVIDEINRQAGGDYSILKQALSEAGQQGSNRQALGANDIDLSRLNQIGQFKQGQYNTALSNALNIMPQSRLQDAQGKLGVGEFLRGLDTQSKLAPVTALQTGTGMISPFVSGSSVQQAQKGGGILGELGNLASGAGAAYLAFSDSQLKHNIRPLGKENGHNIYEFSYIGDNKRYIGVMAQEVPEAAFMTPFGFLAVDYGKIGVQFREAV